MNDFLKQLGAAGRSAAFRRDWATVDACARELLKRENQSTEGHFLAGLVCKASQQADSAVEAFSRTLELDDARYDAAIELANQYCLAQRHGDAFALVDRYESSLSNSPLYLNMAGSIFSGIGMPDRAWPLFNKANELQPGIDLFLANLAGCAVFLGKIEEARQIYQDLLQRHPTHQRYHYQLSRLDKASSTDHIEQMQDVLRSTRQTPDKNVFMHYAIGKEFEDLEHWDDAFKHYKIAGDAVAGVADYDIENDIQLIDSFIDVCNADWLASGRVENSGDNHHRTPVFVVGLPRTGTTLTERIIASHSRVQGVGETQYMQMVIRRESGIVSERKMTPEMVRAAAAIDIRVIRNGYMDLLDFKLGDQPVFVDKLPFNIFYLGFIAKAFPNAKIVHVRRNPMDSCFAMYKQVFTWAYKFSYTLDGLARFYPAYVRLIDHWRSTLGDRLIEVEYESLVAEQEDQTRHLLRALELEFERACLEFNTNESATLTASAVQVREKIHSRSVGRWKNVAPQLEPLRIALEAAGIAADPASSPPRAPGASL